MRSSTMRRGRPALLPTLVGARRADFSKLTLLLPCFLLQLIVLPSPVLSQPPIRLKLIRKQATVGRFSNQPLSVLDRTDQPGGNDSGDDSYIKIIPDSKRDPPKFVASFFFKYDGGNENGNGDLSALTNVRGISVLMNSLGVGWLSQRRVVQIRRWTGGGGGSKGSSSGVGKKKNKRKKGKKRNFEWVAVANNKDDVAMEWTYKESDVDVSDDDIDPRSYFSDKGILQLRIISDNDEEDMFLEYLVVMLKYRTTTGETWWRPRASQWLTWQWQLQGSIDRSFDVHMYDVDLFDTSDVTIRSLKQDDGRIVICYFSAGTYEGWRDDWKTFFPGGTSTMPLAGDMKDWDESWLDIRKLDALSPIMSSRMRLAKDKGCDGVEPDNMDAYTNGEETKIPLTYNDQLTYNRWIAAKAHEYGLSVALKNDMNQLNDLVDDYDFAVNEECFQYNECDKYTSSFLAQDKAVFGVEYSGGASGFCSTANSMRMSWLKKNLDLQAYRVGCETFPGWGSGPPPSPTTTTTTTTPPKPAPTTTTTKATAAPPPSPTTITAASPTPTGGRWLPRSSERLTWQMQLEGTLDTSLPVDVYLVDIFNTSPDQIRSLQNEGKRVICHFSSGTYENWRSDWQMYFPGGHDTIPILSDIGGWGEYWLDISQWEKLKPIMSSRVQFAVDRGCDAIEPGVMDSYAFVPEAANVISAADQFAYSTYLATEAHAQGISAALMNDIDQASQLASVFDFAVNSECFEYNECEKLKAFTNLDKAVFGLEYNGDPALFCPKAADMGMSWIKKKSNLDATRIGCESFVSTTPTTTTTTTTKATATTTTTPMDPSATPLPPTNAPASVPTSGIWQPRATDSLTWQIQLAGTLQTDVNADVFVIDMFDVPKSKIDVLKGKGRIVLCRFSAGTYEDWREDWGVYFPGGLNTIPIVADIGGWGEYWLDISKIDDLRPIMQSRMNLAKSKGCDGIVPDVVDAYAYATGASNFMDKNDQLTYNRWIASEARKLGLSVGLKNGLDQISQLVGDFDFAVNEQCFEYNECDKLKPFTDANKAVFGLEYNGGLNSFCTKAKQAKMSFIKKTTNLGAWLRSC